MKFFVFMMSVCFISSTINVIRSDDIQTLSFILANLSGGLMVTLIVGLLEEIKSSLEKAKEAPAIKAVDVLEGKN